MRLRIALLKEDHTWEESSVKMWPAGPMGYETHSVIWEFYQQHKELYAERCNLKKPYVGIAWISKERKKK